MTDRATTDPEPRHQDLRLRASQAAGLVGATTRQLDYWARTGLLTPSVSHADAPALQRLYSFDDLVRLKIIKRLLDAGMSLRRIRTAIELLSDVRLADRDASSLTILSDGPSIYLAHSADEVIETFRRGQGVFGIAIEPVADEMTRAVRELGTRPAEPGNKQEARDLRDYDYGFIDELASLVRERILDSEADWRAGGESLLSLGDVGALARRLTASVPLRSSWDDRIGPFYTTRSLSDKLGGLSRQAVLERRQRGSLLSMRTSDGVWVYPAWQLFDDGTPIPGLREVLRPFTMQGVDGWNIAAWFESTFKQLGGESPRQCLLTGKNTELLPAMAREAAVRLAA